SLSPVRRAAARRWIERRRPEYEAAVQGVETIVANSRNVSDRIRRFLGRSSEVVYPPVDTGRYRFSRVGDFWLSVNRLSHEKRIDLQMEVFRRLPQDRLAVAADPRAIVPGRLSARRHGALPILPRRRLLVVREPALA